MRSYRKKPRLPGLPGPVSEIFRFLGLRGNGDPRQMLAILASMSSGSIWAPNVLPFPTSATTSLSEIALRMQLVAAFASLLSVHATCSIGRPLMPPALLIRSTAI